MILPLLVLLTVQPLKACPFCPSGYQFMDFVEFPIPHESGSSIINCGDFVGYLTSPEANAFQESCDGSSPFCWESCEAFHSLFIEAGCCGQESDGCWIQKGVSALVNVMSARGVQKLSSVIANSGCVEVMADKLSISNEVLSLKGLEAIVHVGKLEIFHLKNMTSLEGLNGLRTVVELDVFTNFALTSLRGLNALSFACTFHIYDNDLLSSMDGVDSLQSLGGCVVNEPLPVKFDMPANISAHVSAPNHESTSLFLGDNKVMTSCQGLGALEQVIGLVSIKNNPQLISLDGLSALVNIICDDVGTYRYTCGFGVETNPKLKYLGLKSLKRIEFSVVVATNDALMSVEALERVINYDTMIVVWIQENPLLCISSQQLRIFKGATEAYLQDCSCHPGFFPHANVCTSCPAGTFCIGGEEKQQPCPPGSNSTGGNTFCKCTKGFEPNGTSPNPVTKSWNCRKCSEFATSAGENKYCFCDNAKHGVYDFYQDGSICNCPQQKFMSRSVQHCQDCGEGEECEWDFMRARSGDTLRPPSIKPGYWAEMATSNSIFSGYSVWKCHSTETCLGNGTCAAHRTGIACGDCFSGFHGGPDGPCSQCKFAPATHRAVFLCIMVGIMLATTLLLQVTARVGQKLAMAQDIKRVWRSVKQVVKYLQLLGVVYTFDIRWPASLQSLFEFLMQFSLPIDGVFVEQCLVHDHSLELFVYYRCALPAVVLCMLMAPVPLAYVGARAMKSAPCQLIRRLAQRVPIKVSNASQFAFQIFSIFFISILNSITSFFRCRGNPNGQRVVQEFPQFRCFENRWMDLVPVLGAAMFCYVMCHVIGLIFIFRGCCQSLQASEGRSRGTFAFIVEDFRTTQIIFPVVIVMKDIAINIVSVLPVHPGLQLAFALIVLALYSVVVLKESPFEDPISNKLEVFLHASLILQLAVIESNESSTEMTSFFTCWLLISLAAGVAIIILQIMLAIPGLSEQVPQMFKPLSKKHWEEQVTQVFDHMDQVVVKNRLRNLDQVNRARQSRLLSWNVQLKADGILSHQGLWPVYDSSCKSPSGATGAVSITTERKDEPEGKHQEISPIWNSAEARTRETEDISSHSAPIKVDPNKIAVDWADVINVGHRDEDQDEPEITKITI